MSTPNPAAQALIAALANPALDDAGRRALTLALQTALEAPASALAQPASEQAEPKVRRERGSRANAPARKAEAILLGKEAIAALPLPAAGERLLYDTVRPQLAVRLRPGGKSFVVITWDSERKRTVKQTLGRVDKLTVDQARRAAASIVARVVEGEDVRRPAVELPTLDELLSEWQREKGEKVRTATELVAKVRQYAGPLLFRRVDEIATEQIGAIHTHIATEARRQVAKRDADGVVRRQAVGERGLPATADKWVASLSAVFEWAVSKKRATLNPASGIPPVYDTKAAKRTRYLQGDELRRFWKALEADGDADARDVFLLAMFTGQRRGNVLSMEWAHVDIEAGIWSMSAAHTKQKDAQSVPLPSQARAVLERRQQSAATRWVFPAASTRTPGAKLGCMTETRLRDAWSRILEAACIQDLRVHDLRHTSGSWLARLGTDQLTRQKALGHATAAASERYAHLELDPVAQALQRAANAIESTASRTPAPVVDVRAARKGKRRG